MAENPAGLRITSHLFHQSSKLLDSIGRTDIAQSMSTSVSIDYYLSLIVTPILSHPF